MHSPVLALLALLAATTLAVPLPGDLDGPGNSKQHVAADQAESLYQCVWEYQRSTGASYKASLNWCKMWRQWRLDKLAYANQVPQEEVKKVEEDKEGVVEKPEEFLSSLVRRPAVSQMVKSIKKVHVQPLGLPSVPGALGAFPI